MKRSLIVLALCLFASPGHAMTATVSTSPPPPQGAPSSTNTPATSDAANRAIIGATSAKSAAPAAASVTGPTQVLSAPGVPPRASAAQTAKPAGARTKQNTFMPSASSRSGAVAPAPDSAAWAVTARQGNTMRRGTLEAVNVGAGTFQVYKQKLNFNPQRVKVYTKDGKAGSVFAMKAGASVRFTLDPTDAKQKRVAVIYVD